MKSNSVTEGDDLSLAKAIDITTVMLYEVTKKQLASMAASAGNNVDALRLGRNKQHSHHGPKSTPVPDKHPCRNCGGKHGEEGMPSLRQVMLLLQEAESLRKSLPKETKRPRQAGYIYIAGQLH